MPIRNIDQIFHHLEQTAEDELALLVSTGPKYFTTQQLWKLRGQWEVKNRLFRRFQNLLVRLVAFSPLWILGWAFFQWIRWTYPALLCLALFPLSFVLFFAGLLFMRSFFKGKGHLDLAGEMIETELRKRIRQEDY